MSDSITYGASVFVRLDTINTNDKIPLSGRGYLHNDENQPAASSLSIDTATPWVIRSTWENTQDGKFGQPVIDGDLVYLMVSPTPGSTRGPFLFAPGSGVPDAHTNLPMKASDAAACAWNIVAIPRTQGPIAYSQPGGTGVQFRSGANVLICGREDVLNGPPYKVNAQDANARTSQYWLWLLESAAAGPVSASSTPTPTPPTPTPPTPPTPTPPTPTPTPTPPTPTPTPPTPTPTPPTPTPAPTPFDVPPNTSFAVTVLWNSKAEQTVDIVLGSDTDPSYRFTGQSGAKEDRQTAFLTSDANGGVHVNIWAGNVACQTQTGQFPVPNADGSIVGIVSAHNGSDEDSTSKAVVVILAWSISTQ